MCVRGSLRPTMDGPNIDPLLHLSDNNIQRDEMSDEKLNYVSYLIPSWIYHNSPESMAIIIIEKLLKSMDHSAQHRVLDYFKSKYNVSKAVITKN